MTARATRLAVVVAAILLAACSSLPPTHYYVLELEPEAAPAAAAGSAAAGAVPAAWTIGVRPFAVDAPYDQDRIVYRHGERSPEIGFYAYHVWAAPLSEMIPGAVSTGLRGAAGVAALEPVVTGRRYDAFLHGRVLAVEEIDLPDSQSVRASIELRLHAHDGGELWSELVEARADTHSSDVAEIVKALGSALGEALGETRAELGRVVSGLTAE
jgi:uncharacterized lipoprotein YmbA